MRIAINILGYIILSALAIGTLFKLMHWPGASIIQVWGMSAFTFFFVPVFFIQRIRESETGLEKTTNTFGLISVFFCSGGLLFKNMHWPGGSMIITLGTVLFLIALILYVISQFKAKNKSKIEMAKTIFIGVFVFTFMLIYGLKPSTLFIDGYRLMDNNQKTSISIINKLIEKQKPFNTTLQVDSDANSLIRTIEGIKEKVITQADGNCSPEKLADIHNIVQFDNIDAAGYTILFSSESGTTIGNNLRNQINNLKESYTALINKYPSSTKESTILEISRVLDTRDVRNHVGERYSWEESLFDMKPVATAITTLTGIELNIRNAQYITNQYLIENSK